MVIELNEYQLYNGIFSTIFVVISVIIGLRILLRYSKFEKKELITVGLTWIFLSSPWWSAVYVFWGALFNIEFEVIFNIFITYAFIPNSSYLLDVFLQ